MYVKCSQEFSSKISQSLYVTASCKSHTVVRLSSWWRKVNIAIRYKNNDANNTKKTKAKAKALGHKALGQVGWQGQYQGQGRWLQGKGLEAKAEAHYHWLER